MSDPTRKECEAALSAVDRRRVRYYPPRNFAGSAFAADTIRAYDTAREQRIAELTQALELIAQKLGEWIDGAGFDPCGGPEREIDWIPVNCEGLARTILQPETPSNWAADSFRAALGGPDPVDDAVPGRPLALIENYRQEFDAKGRVIRSTRDRVIPSTGEQWTESRVPGGDWRADERGTA